MDNLKSKIQKILSISFYILVLITFLFLQYLLCFKPILIPSDELINFQNLYKMFNGLELYKDINVIVTPLFFLIGKIVLTIFSPTIFSFRIFNFIIGTLFHVILFYIIYQKTNSPMIATVYFSTMFNFTYRLLLGGANYNLLALTFVLLGVATFIKFKDKKYYHLLQGFIVFLVFFTKQSFGVFYGISILIYELVFYRKCFIKNNIKKFIAFIIPLIIYFLYLISNNNLYNFINYAFLGIHDFTTNIGFEAWAGVLLVLPINIILFFKFKNYIDKSEWNDLTFLIFVSCGLLFISYPIFNQGHVLLPFTIIGTTFLLIIHNLLISEIIDFEKCYMKIIFAILTLFLLTSPVVPLLSNGQSYGKALEGSKVYEKVLLSNEYYDDTIKLLNYIKLQKSKGYKVVIISYQSMITNIYNHDFHGDFDSPYIGNFGIDGEDKLVEKIKNSDNKTLYLIKNTSTIYTWQESTRIKHYVENSLHNQGKIADFSIYSK